MLSALCILFLVTIILFLVTIALIWKGGAHMLSALSVTHSANPNLNPEPKPKPKPKPKPEPNPNPQGGVVYLKRIMLDTEILSLRQPYNP